MLFPLGVFLDVVFAYLEFSSEIFSFMTFSIILDLAAIHKKSVMILKSSNLLS